MTLKKFNFVLSIFHKIKNNRNISSDKVNWYILYILILYISNIYKQSYLELCLPLKCLYFSLRTKNTFFFSFDINYSLYNPVYCNNV